MATAQELNNYNLNKEIVAENSLVTEKETLVLYTKLSLNLKKADIHDYSFSFYSVNNYYKILPPLERKIAVDSTYINSQGNTHYFKFTIKPTTPKALLMIAVKSELTGKVFLYDLPLFITKPFNVFNSNGVPVTSNWANPGTYTLSKSPVTVFYYSHTFPPGLPPMVTRPELEDKEILVESTYKVYEELAMEDQGLYLMQIDTSSTNALPIRVEDKYFPKFTTVQQLVEPLIYITSKEEQEQLQKINGDKRLFDKFWLDMTNSAERAKSIIRTFYDRTEVANRLFTTFKEGWKTDMGMIYIVMGPPDEIERSNKEETWVYLADRDLPKRKYTFIRSNSIFSPAHYVLIREKKHAASWFEAIDLLRKGIINQK